MARKKEYNKEDVLNAATNVFWEKGFKGTSISDLVSATGLNKHSMYEEFGNKEGLFLECLNLYATKIQKSNLEILSREPVGLENIELFLQGLVNYASTIECLGCMVINSVVEKQLLTEEAFNFTEKYLERLESLISRCIQAAQTNGEVSKKYTPDILAKHILTVSAGLMVIGKTKQSKESLEMMVDMVLTTLKK